MSVVHALHELGLHETVALAAFDDVDMADVVDPALTVVPQRPADLGRQAGELLLDRIRGYRGPARRVILRNELVVRGSGEVAPAAGDGRAVARRRA
jgi:LacI family transcriptional regulator